MESSIKSKLWQECISCKINCCKSKDVSFHLFLTEAESKKYVDINDKFPCRFLTEDGLCEIHAERPIDCRLYPFDFIEKDGIFFWMYWEIPCPILDNGIFEPYLLELEKNIIPYFKKNIRAYSQHKFDELSKKYNYQILREVKF